VEPERDIEVLVISDHTLVREGIRSFFAASRYKIRHETESITKAIELAKEHGDLIFISLRLEEAIMTPLKVLRQAYPRSRIVFYAQRAQLPRSGLLEMFGVSLDGCLLSDSSLQVLQQSLNLIMMGESVFPFSLLLASFPNEGEAAEGAHASSETMFSDRERQVLNFLRDGRPNKFIARELQLSEATIKVHMKTLLAKIGCTNRTQAAIWATRQSAMWSGEKEQCDRDGALWAPPTPASAVNER
jgi:two-component system nitrate/nitrite response regulator NarL